MSEQAVNQEFQEWANAKTWGTGNYFEAGRYKLAILETFDNSGKKGRNIIVECVVIESTKTEAKVDPAPVGSKRSAVFKLDGEHGEGAMGRLKEFVQGLRAPNADPAGLGKFMSDIYSDAKRKDGTKLGANTQPVRGKFVTLEASTSSKPTRATASKPKDEQVFVTNLKWIFVEQTKEQYEAERKRLDAANL